jgi:hypothetical protein
MKRSIRRRLAPLLAVVIATTGMAFAASAAQATTIVSRSNQGCLSTQSWKWAEQIVTRGCNSSVYQQWTFIPVLGNGEPGTYYRISNAYNDLCLDVGWDKRNNGAAVVQSDCWGGDNQLWRRQHTASGAEMLRPRHTQKCLDISTGWLQGPNGNAVHWECSGDKPWQEFWIS